MRALIQQHWRSSFGLTAVVVALAALIAAVNDGGGTLYLMDGTPVHVKRGPLWLARLAYQPPAWLGTAIKVVVVILMVAVAFGYYRHGIDEEVIRDLSETAMVMVSVLAVAHFLAGVTWLPYWAGAVSGGVGGFLLGHGIKTAFYRVFD